MNGIIRFADPDDVDAILAIYAPYIQNTTITFEYIVPERSEFENLLCQTQLQFPWLVYETETTAQAKKIVGFAYGSPQGTRAAYQWNVQYAMYLAEQARGTGVAQKLYAAMEALSIVQGYKTAYALITRSNVASQKFYRKCGFTVLCIHPKTAYKFEHWIDVVWMQKQISQYSVPTLPVTAITELQKSRASEINQIFRNAEGIR